MPAKILGKLKGIIASASEKSRNGRQYTESFWDAIFNSDLFKEGIENKVYFGEMWHPDEEERYGQIHAGKDSAIVLTNVEKKGLDYYGTFEILPTEAGETLKNLIDIGCVFGISSRGYSDYDSSVFNDPSAYDLITFDIVAFPGIKSARLHPVEAVAESFSRKKKVNKKEIMENLKKIANNDKKAKSYILETLNSYVQKAKNSDIKEDFDTDLQVEDLAAFNDIDDDLLQYAKIVTINDKNIPVYDDGANGIKRVFADVYPDYNPGDKFLVDNLFLSEYKDGYFAVGDWLKLN